jgi:NTE family protein
MWTWWRRPKRLRLSMRRLQGVLWAAGVLVLCSCQTTQVPMNEPLPQDAQGMPVYSGGYALLSMIGEPKGEIIFVMAFSGGGKRAAAFAHGVLRGLKQIPVVEDGIRRSLLDEVDYIAGVSGGSFPAMHYGLYHDRSFQTFPRDFLKQDEAHPVVPGWSICSIRVPYAGDLRRARGGTGWLGRDR